MKHALLFTVLLTAALGVAGCRKDSDVATGLVGTWQLVSREGCYCPRGPVPDETVAFTASAFSFAKGGQLAREGTYAEDTATRCGSTALVPVLRLTDAATTTRHNVPYTLSGSQLVLDYSNRCIADSPVDTYQRLP